MSWYRLFTPGDGHFRQNYRTEEDRCVVLQPVLDKWQGYVEKGWMSENHEKLFCTENKTKMFLDSCGSFILEAKGNSKDIITRHKRQRNDEREILFGDEEQLDEIMAADYQDEKKQVPAKPTRFSQIQAIKGKYDGCTFNFCRVDAYGDFIDWGRQYHIDASVEAYSSVPVDNGADAYFQMDTIIVVTEKTGERHYYTQYVAPISSDMITLK